MRRDEDSPLSLPGGGEVDSAQAPGEGTAVLGLERKLAGKLLETMGNPPFALTLWDGRTLEPAPENPVARVHIRDRGAFYRLLRHPDLHFGDDYAAGRIEVEGDLAELLTVVDLTRQQRHGHGGGRPGLTSRLHRARRNTLSGSRENIHHHYDLGNDFYALWLDEDMVYTCAYFADPEMSLEAAQRAKMDHVARKLRLEPGQTVVEAGCGWGSLARHMAREYGVKVRAFNISTEQIAYARERARAEGLEDRVEFVQDDYRNVTGSYDAFVSVGMLEHVGTDNYRDLGAVIDRVLADHGRALVHSIGRNRPIGPMNPWIERRIFPGAYPPSLSEMTEIFEPYSFSIQDVENLRLHYARTLEHWLARYDANEEEVRRRFGESFVRAWRLYLSGSIAAFRAGSLQLFQMVFTRPTGNELPWTREYLYPAQAE
ncbi:cyclopropane-fatty-acyl-phospholipid synthase [Thiohalorhabdus denitrificans]|uniref:Cyclopropane-fatty-acyl-phospholipid synthase n=1 Tax=Thiohalorhabdus denitrificans TaxID=381306 RepID=A0A0P9C971_9GAMM|nr:cyclopropane-fatty-acyl-phospholipid synthase family protein [Thiohalorhabdus denitrificans]KPV41610.1 cyclopropane-fatty-acyl-phospholipid synthase [Thiohalorhabdus denitrificans]SCY57412.1 cyclopropane-fatty-acyl-phospholipid synthase [Thiohalorhabdus denitrificans]